MGVEARVVMAGLASVGLLAAGAWLHDRQSRTEASVAMVRAGSAGLFATAVVASQTYDLISPLVALGGAIVVGAIPTALAIRWGPG